MHVRLMRPSAPALALALAVLSASQLGAFASLPTAEEVLPLSLKFFEAQVSGFKPSFAPSWRGDSHLSDGQISDDVTFDLVGGWYTDGGHLKNTMTTATAVSLMAYAALTFETTVTESGVLQQLVQNVDYAADYLVKCANVAEGRFAAQVGDHFNEEQYWGAPEDQPFDLIKFNPGWRPVYLINMANKYSGADVVSETVAALTGAALLHKKLANLGVSPAANLQKASDYLDVADRIWDTAQQMYAVWPVPEGNRTVYSRTYTDDQTWAAAWKCKRAMYNNEDQGPCTDAWTKFYSKMKLREGYLNTDDMHAAALSMLVHTEAGAIAGYIQDLKVRYLDEFEKHIVAGIGGEGRCDPCAPRGSVCSIAGGFVIGLDRAPVIYAINMAYLALVATQNEAHAAYWGANKVKGYRCAAKFVVDFLLGKNPNKQAFVTGLDETGITFDANFKFPKNPRHRGASCYKGGAPCATASVANPHKLIGALVGGPRANGTYTDSRLAEPDNLVSVEHNAPLFGALLGVKAYGEVFNWDTYCADWPVPRR